MIEIFKVLYLITRDVFSAANSAKKGRQKYLISIPNPISVILRTDVLLSGKSPSMFLREKLGWQVLDEI